MGGYAADGIVTLPPQFEAVFGTLAASGTVYYGLYVGVNQVMTAGADATGASGTFDFLAEPKTAYPDSVDAALTELLRLFPGAAGPDYAPASTGAAGYVFTAVGGTTYVLGFVQYEGVAIAYVSAGSGDYSSAALDTAR